MTTLSRLFPAARRCLLVVALLPFALNAADAKRRFDLPAGEATATLPRFAEQADREIVFSPAAVKGVQTNAVAGEFTAREALDLLVARTGLTATHDAATGAFAVRTETPAPNAPRAAAAPNPVRPESSGTMRAGNDEAPLTLSVFEVTTARDDGYRATNSIAGTRTSVAIKDLPMSMQVMTEEFISDIGTANLADVMTYASGVNAAGQTSFSGESDRDYNFRGFLTDVVLRNGFRGRGSADTYNIERVEILKGPGSLLYGQIQPGGFMNYITKKPTARRQFSTKISIGSYERYRAELDANVPLTKDGRVLFRLMGAVEDSQFIEVYASRYKAIINPAVTVKLAERTKWTVDYEFNRADLNPRGTTPQTPPAVNPDGRNNILLNTIPRSFNFRTAETFSDRRTGTWTSELVHAFDARWSLRQALNYVTTENSSHLIGSAGLTGARGDQLSRGATHSNGDATYLFAQTDLSGKFEVARLPVQLLLGTDYRRDRANNTNYGSLAAFTPRAWNITDPATWNRTTPSFPSQFSLTSSAAQDSRDIGAYTILQAELWDKRLRFLGGVRYDDYQNTGTNLVTRRADPKTTLKNWVEQAGLLYRVRGDFSLYVSGSKSFEPINGLKQNEDGSQSLYKPRTGESAEIGFKTDFWSGRLSSTVAFFTLTQENQPRLIQTRGAGNVVVNSFTEQSGRDRSEGVEVDFVLSPTDSWQVLGSYSNLDTYTVSNREQPAFVGLPLRNVPKHKGSVRTRYKISQGALKGLWFAAGAQFTGGGRIAQTTLTSDVLDGFSLYSASVGYRWRLFGVDYTGTLAFQNLGNADYLNSNFDRGAPRTVNATVTMRF